jgi:hypothetical protein
MNRRCLKRNNRGQVLVVTSLLIALLFLSTAMYIIGTEKTQPVAQTAQDNVFPVYQQSLRNTVISALANITSGGPSAALTSDKDTLTQTITSHSYQSILKMTYTPLNTEPYQDGLLVSWGADGWGISSAYVTFTLDSLGSSATSTVQYCLNVTSQVNLSGNTEQINDTFTQANLTVNLFNEGKPALAQNLSFNYQNGTDQIKVDNPNLTDFGNGTYKASFTVENASYPLSVSVLCQDQRGIFVGANAICTVI